MLQQLTSAAIRMVVNMQPLMAVVHVTTEKYSGNYLGELSVMLLHDAINVCKTTVKLSTSHACRSSG